MSARRAGLTVAVLVGVSMVPISTHGYSVPVDRFSVTRDLAASSPTVITDNFDSGVRPPEGPLGSRTYAVSDHFDAVEDGGRLVLDSSFGTAQGPTPFGRTFKIHLAVLRTGTPLADPLSRDLSFSAEGVFDVYRPEVVDEAYGIHFIDRLDFSQSNDDVQLIVRRTPSNELKLQFGRLDWTAGTVNIYGEAALDPLAAQVGLRLLNSADNVVTAYYAYDEDITNSVWTSLGDSTSIFNGEPATSAGFFARAPVVPVPAAMPLFASALTGLACGGRRRWRRSS